MATPKKTAPTVEAKFDALVDWLIEHLEHDQGAVESLKAKMASVTPSSDTE